MDFYGIKERLLGHIVEHATYIGGCFSVTRWKGTKKTQKTGSKTGKTPQQGGRRSSSSPQHKGETVPVLVSSATSELRSALALSLVQGFAEEESSSDMTHAEKQLEGKGSPLEELVVQSSGAVLSSAATFCCGGQEAAGTGNLVRMEQVDREGMEKEQSVRNRTLGKERNQVNSFMSLFYPKQHCVVEVCLRSL